MTPASTRGLVAHGEISFGRSQDAFDHYDSTLRDLISSHGCRSICEVGGGANPSLPLDFIKARGLRHCLLDISAEELAKAPDGYEKIVADITSDTPPVGGPFDIVVSKMLAEHVRRPRQFHENVRSLLRPGGIAFHFFPTLWSPPFIANLLLPERLATRVLQLVSPRDLRQYAKFPAYYRWCRGPTATQRRRLERLGYLVERYTGFFGHGYYNKIPVVRGLHAWAADLLLRHPVAWLTSFAYVVLRRTDAEAVAS